jgi:ABC-type transporter Mla MlaB component
MFYEGLQIREKQDKFDIETWLGSVYTLEEQNKFDVAGDVLVNHLDNLLKAGAFEYCDKVLQVADLQRIEASGIALLLDFTYPAKERLPSRAEFCVRARARLLELLGDAERVERLMCRRGYYTDSGTP